MYGRLAVNTFKEDMAYRLHFFVGILSSFITMAVLWYVWTAIFEASAEPMIGGYTLSAMITYVIVSSAIRVFQFTRVEFNIENHVKTGFVSNLIIKPWNYFMYNFSIETGNMVFSLATRTLPILAVGFLIIGISAPANALLFAVSAILGYLVSYAISFLTGLWSFWSSGNIWGIRYARHVVSDVMSGALIPLSLFPAWFVSLSIALPFQAIFFIPLSIYIGSISGYDALIQIGIQALWVLILYSLCFAVWRIAERKVVVHGG